MHVQGLPSGRKGDYGQATTTTRTKITLFQREIDRPFHRSNLKSCRGDRKPTRIRARCWRRISPNPMLARIQQLSSTVRISWPSSLLKLMRLNKVRPEIDGKKARLVVLLGLVLKMQLFI